MPLNNVSYIQKFCCLSNLNFRVSSTMRMSRAHSYSHSRAHSPSFPLLNPRHSWFSNPSVALPTSQLILQLFRCFTYVTAHSLSLLSLLLRHRRFTYVTWRPPMLYKCCILVNKTSSFSKFSVASPTSQLILQLLRCFNIWQEVPGSIPGYTLEIFQEV